MKRSELRENIFKLIFRAEFHPFEEMDEQVMLYGQVHPEVEEADFLYIKDKIHALMDVLTTIDETIFKISEGWKIERIGKAELSILRVAIYEIQYDKDIPTGVAINEAVNLAKIYGSEDSSKYVNGVLAKLA